MVRTFLATFFSVWVYAALHSLLASLPAKRKAAQWFGARQRSGLYRVFFNAQSALTMGGLLLFLRSLPDWELYRARGPLALLMRAGQAAGLALALNAAAQIGVARVTGLAPLLSWLSGDPSSRPEPEAQGPAPALVSVQADGSPGYGGGALRAGGAFRISRHPLNLAPLPIFWLTPRMTIKRLAFNLAGSLYLALGSLHEERRLLAAYGDHYRDYQRSGVPFYLPGFRLRRLARRIKLVRRLRLPSRF